MSLFYPNQLEYLSEVLSDLCIVEPKLKDSEGIYGVKILLMDLTRDIPIGHIDRDDQGSLRIELDDSLL